MVKIGFIGMGNMGNAILNGLLKTHRPEDMIFSAAHQDKMEAVTARTKVPHAGSNRECAKAVKYLILAVKPQYFDAVFSEIRDVVQGEDWNNLPRAGWKQVADSPLTIDLGKSVTLASFTYAPSKAEAKPTMAFRYKFFVSMDGKHWKEVPANGEFSNIMHNPLPQTVTFGQKVQARYIKLEATTPTATTAKVGMDEIGVTVAP